MPVKPRKVKFHKKICTLLDAYSKILIALFVHVKSNQMHIIRADLRDHSVLLMGKNTLMKKCIEMHAESTGNKAFLILRRFLEGNVGLIFTKADFKVVIEALAKHTVDPSAPAPARGLDIKALYDGGSVFRPEDLGLIESSMSLTSPSLAISQPILPESSDTLIDAYKDATTAAAAAPEVTVEEKEPAEDYDDDRRFSLFD